MTNNNISSPFGKGQIKDNDANRIESRILVKPRYEGRAYPCYESGFESTCVCPRVSRMEAMRRGIVPATAEEKFDLKGKQPVFFLQEHFGGDGRWEWNGLLLFTSSDAERARKVIKEHAKELNVILSFEDPDTHFYHFLIDTGETDLSNENFLSVRSDMDWQLKAYLHSTAHHDLVYYVRALPIEYYDIIDRDALFGKPEEPVVDSFQSCSDMPLGELLKVFIGRLFKSA